MLAAFIALSVLAAILLLALYIRRRGERFSPGIKVSLNAEGLDTTLGDFHDMREALRPLEHTEPRPAATQTAPGRKDPLLGRIAHLSD